MLRFLTKIAGRHVVLALSMFGLWLLLSGYFTYPSLLTFGIISVLLTTWLAQRAGMLDREGVPTRVFPGIFAYMLWLTVEIGKSNLIVTMHALSPKLKLSPTMVTVPAYQASDLGKVIFANSITLTPSTVSVDLHENNILIHALTAEMADVAGMIAMGERVCAFDGPEGRDWVRQRKAERRAEADRAAAERQAGL
ncbi:Na+/H+ antiporter subunit E [Aquisalinus flavus]|uniref:Cation transporter n=1 Tax=Aquisalinus flavus TaxID=1526572 RepID=A0A8J2Y7Y4_9PROT|nr:Na+/H+ antiporter subunit E [Aquisalinus flavus]MBD0426260.1 Na+/H+ antiporter subunit E [Aquisalinus flavus]UNE48168.1 cation transporter [Aquisalinus flavus]GGD09359.1 cation transporter [Aquisalinus flavus]